MEINVTDYLSEADLREIAIEEWRKVCREACNGHSERIIGNIAHAVVTDMVAEALGDDANEKIKAKAISLIDNMSEFSVFQRPNVWEPGSTPAFKTLMEAVVANRPLIEAKIKSCISNLSKREALEIIKSGVIQINPGKAA